MTAGAAHDGDAAIDGRTRFMATLLVARRLHDGARRRRGGRLRARIFRRDPVRYATPSRTKLGLSLSTRRPTRRRPRPPAIRCPALLQPPLPRAPGTPRMQRAADPAEHHHVPTARTPPEPPVQNPAAPSRSGWTPAATGDTLSIGGRVGACSPRRLGCSTTRAFTFSDVRDLRRQRRGRHRRRRSITSA
jgi:hypothetical protein